MKKLCLQIVFVLLVSSAYSQIADDFPLWLKGMWEIRSESGSSFESWTQINDSVLSGRTFRIFSGDTIVFDTMKIKIADSKIIYEMSANVKNTRVYAGYLLQKPVPELWRFENSLTDFPRNINYQKMGVDSVYVWTESSEDKSACMDYMLIRFKNE